MNHYPKGRLVVLSLVMIVIVLIASSYAYLVSLPPHEGPTATILSYPFEFSIQLNKDRYQQFQQDVYDNVSITLTLRNIGNKTISVAWDSYYSIGRKLMFFDVLITDSNGMYLYQLSRVHFQIASRVSRTLEPGAQLVCLLVWQQWTDDPSHPFAEKGEYLVKGLTRNMYAVMDDMKQSIRLETPTIFFSIF